MFNLSKLHIAKRRALGLTILCAVLTVLFILWHLATCIVPALLLGTIFGGIYYVKYRRDVKLVEAGQAQAVRAGRQLPGAPPMTSEDSTGLFVPLPLDR